MKKIINKLISKDNFISTFKGISKLKKTSILKGLVGSIILFLICLILDYVLEDYFNIFKWFSKNLADKIDYKALFDFYKSYMILIITLCYISLQLAASEYTGRILDTLTTDGFLKITFASNLSYLTFHILTKIVAGKSFMSQQFFIIFSVTILLYFLSILLSFLYTVYLLLHVKPEELLNELNDKSIEITKNIKMQDNTDIEISYRKLASNIASISIIIKKCIKENNTVLVREGLNNIKHIWDKVIDINKDKILESWSNSKANNDKNKLKSNITYKEFHKNLDKFINDRMDFIEVDHILPKDSVTKEIDYDNLFVFSNHFESRYDNNTNQEIAPERIEEYILKQLEEMLHDSYKYNQPRIKEDILNLYLILIHSTYRDLDRNLGILLEIINSLEYSYLNVIRKFEDHNDLTYEYLEEIYIKIINEISLVYGKSKGFKGKLASYEEILEKIIISFAKFSEKAINKGNIKEVRDICKSLKIMESENERVLEHTNKRVITRRIKNQTILIYDTIIKMGIYSLYSKQFKITVEVIKRITFSFIKYNYTIEHFRLINNCNENTGDYLRIQGNKVFEFEVENYKYYFSKLLIIYIAYLDFQSGYRPSTKDEIAITMTILDGFNISEIKNVLEKDLVNRAKEWNTLFLGESKKWLQDALNDISS